MNKNKLLAAGALALSMAMTPVASLINTMPVMAANVTVESSSNAGDLLKDHTFTAYQIFSGTVKDGALTDVDWGNGINESAFLSALKTDDTTKSTFENCHTAPDVAQALKNVTGSSDVATKFARIAKENIKESGTVIPANGANLDQGYYVIVDTTTGDPAVYNPALLEVVGGDNDNVVIELKNDVPTVEKKVKEDDHTVTGDTNYGEKYNDVADYNIGETIPFSFYSKVPANIAQYDTYEYTFTDTMSKGLTLGVNSIEVKVGETTLTKGTDYTVTGPTAVPDSTTGEQTFSVTIANLKTITAATAGAEIRVNFNAALNNDAVVGLPGNPNKVNLTYSNNPNDSSKKHTTPDDTVVVFTYELDVTKEDNANADIKLSDAKFELWDASNKDNHNVAVVKDGKFVKWVTAAEASKVPAADGTVTLTTTENGTFAITGLDAGTYYLKETEAPDGYICPEAPFTVVITSTTKNDNNWDGRNANEALMSLTVTVDGTAGTANANTGAAGVTIKNSNTSQLPETGGMGTTLIYGAGALMVAGAAVVFVTNKRTRKS